MIATIERALQIIGELAVFGVIGAAIVVGVLYSLVVRAWSRP